MQEKALDKAPEKVQENNNWKKVQEKALEQGRHEPFNLRESLGAPKMQETLEKVQDPIEKVQEKALDKAIEKVQ